MTTLKLIVMAGLPGSGKSTLAEGLSRHFSLPLLSVDPIEAAMWRGGLCGIKRGSRPMRSQKPWQQNNCGSIIPS
ncbi:AAA family ATPase [Bradyrhizobium sp. AUGA SZCCT0169]|uniref:AAA family ATPase n=1 Tax=Bradyrhizobium sp. AUGA SZCCT0169 TaxID=2807663 RepID=UPI001BA50E99|nr:AAA family ATPase [Bradyrhizobium sp. AUGA SZCCT0169]MBR1248575.1 AAA family ATPase [Bradyrhizobium sp. AUGA SZCCT0169]